MPKYSVTATISNSVTATVVARSKEEAEKKFLEHVTCGATSDAANVVIIDDSGDDSDVTEVDLVSEEDDEDDEPSSDDDK